MSQPSTFMNESNKAIIAKINRCTELFSKTKGGGKDSILNFDLPKMVVIGSQSSGKSSILEVRKSNIEILYKQTDRQKES